MGQIKGAMQVKMKTLIKAQMEIDTKFVDILKQLNMVEEVAAPVAKQPSAPVPKPAPIPQPPQGQVPAPNKEADKEPAAPGKPQNTKKTGGLFGKFMPKKKKVGGGGA